MKDNFTTVHSPQFVLDLGKVKKAYNDLTNSLGATTIHYAIKANPHPAIITQLHSLGCRFEVCSSGELDLVLNLGVNPRELLYSHPVKTVDDIEYALMKGIRVFVVDQESELQKLKPFSESHEITLLFRLGFTSQFTTFNLAEKFGILSDSEFIKLIQEAKKSGFKQFGISFHNGSQNTDPGSFKTSIRSCIQLIDFLENEGISISIVDIGGGFPATYTTPSGSISSYVSAFSQHLKELSAKGISVIAEPGRYLCAEAMELHCTIIGKTKRHNKMWYFIDDSIYNSFSGIWCDHARYPFDISDKTRVLERTLPSVIAGNTCDSIDVIEHEVMLPELQIGDRLIFFGIGAYSHVAASNFNGFPKTGITVIHA